MFGMKQHAQNTEQNMYPQWEYTTKVEHPYDTTLNKLLNKMSKDGWELTTQSSIQTTAFTSRIVYTFRRRKV